MQNRLDTVIEASHGLGEVVSIHPTKESTVQVQVLVSGLTGILCLAGWLVQGSGVRSALRHDPETFLLAMFIAFIGAGMLFWAFLRQAPPSLTFQGITTLLTRVGSIGLAMIIGALTIVMPVNLTLFTLGALSFGASLYLVQRHVRDLDGLAILFDHGFNYAIDGRVTSIHWESIESVKMTWSEGIYPLHAHRLRFRDRRGKTFWFWDPGLEDYDNLLGWIVEAVSPASRAPEPLAPMVKTELPADNRIAALIESSSGLGEVLSIHTAWPLGLVRPFGWLFGGFVLGAVGMSIVFLPEHSGIRGTAMPVISIFLAGLGAVVLITAGRAGARPSLTMWGITTRSQQAACIATHLLLVSPFFLASYLSMGYMLVGLGGDFLLSAILDLRRKVHGQDGIALLFEYGFCYAFNGNVTAMSWDEMKAVRFSRGKYGEGIDLLMHRGESLYFFDPDLDNYLGLFKSIYAAVAETSRLRAALR